MGVGESFVEGGQRGAVPFAGKVDCLPGFFFIEGWFLDKKLVYHIGLEGAVTRKISVEGVGVLDHGSALPVLADHVRQLCDGGDFLPFSAFFSAWAGADPDPLAPSDDRGCTHTFVWFAG